MASKEQINLIENAENLSVIRKSTYTLPEISTLKSNKKVSVEDPVNKEVGESICYKCSSNRKICLPQNIDVLNMVIDVPSSESIVPLHEAAIIGNVFQECLDILNIICYTIPEKIDKNWNENYKTVDEKFGDLDEQEKILGENLTAADKLQRDRTYAYDVLNETLQDIKKNGRFDRLKNEVENIAKMIEEERALKINYEKFSAFVQQTEDLINSQKIGNEEAFQELTKLAGTTYIQADQSIFLNHSELEYVKRWEEDRIDQQNLKMEQEERKMINEINKNLRMKRIEKIVTADTQAYINDYIANLENKTKEWTNKYNEDIAKTEREIYDLREAIDDQKEDLKEIYNLYAARQIFIDGIHEEKTRIKKENEYLKLVNKSAIIIQSFWRGYMVRDQLGEHKELWARLKRRKKLAAIARKRRKNWKKKKAKE